MHRRRTHLGTTSTNQPASPLGTSNISWSLGDLNDDVSESILSRDTSWSEWSDSVGLSQLTSTEPSMELLLEQSQLRQSQSSRRNESWNAIGSWVEAAAAAAATGVQEEKSDVSWTFPPG
eukprot:2355326-Pyramimonas_sp.AAC.1